MPPRKRTPKKYPADELKTISSMGTRVDDLQARNRKDMNDLNRKIGGTANRLKFDTARNAIEVRRAGEADQVKEVTKSVTKILDKLGLTIAALSKGIVQMTAATAVATKEAIQDYGRAVSEDIRVNKANFVAMSLSQASPIFGYFVGKLFETNIFRTALEKIRGKASALFSGLAEKFRKSKEQEEMFFEEGEPAIGGPPVRKAKAAARRVKHVVGGVAGRARGGRAGARVGGRARPIGGGVGAGGGAGGGIGEEAIASLRETTITSSEGIINAIRETSKIQTAEYKKNFSYLIKLLGPKAPGSSLLVQIHKELHSVRTAIVEEEQVSFDLMQTIQQLLGETGFLSKTFKVLSTAYKGIVGPIKWLFSIRGGYRADLPKSGNIFKNMFDTLALIYTKGMVKLDIISNYLLQIGNSLRKVTGAGPMQTAKEEGLYTYFGKIKDWMKERKRPSEEREKKSLKDRVLDFLVDQYDLDRAAMEEAISMIPAKYKEKGAKVFQKAEETRERVVDSLAGIFMNTKEIIEVEKGKENKEEEKEKKSTKEKIVEKVLAAKEKVLDEAKKRKGLWGLITTGAMFLFGLLKSLFSPFLSLLGKGLGLAGRGLLGAGKGLGKLAVTGMGKGLSLGGGAIAGIMSGFEVGKEKGTAAGIAQGAISGSLSTIGGLILGPLGIVLGKMLGDALGKYAFKLGDWLAEHFNIFTMIQDYIITPINKFFSSIGSGIKKLLGIKEEAAAGIVPGSYAEKGLKLRAEGKIKFAGPPEAGLTTGGEKAGMILRPGVDMEGLKPAVSKNFSNMAQEYNEKTGQNVVVNSAFRDRAKQEELYKTNPYAAAPGHSPHEKGRAIDIQSVNAGQLDSMGLLDKYSFNRPVPGEPWHLQTQVGDAPFRRSAISTRDILTMQANRETMMAKAFLDSSEKLQGAIGTGLAEVSKGVASNATVISSTIISNAQNVGAGRGARGSESDLDLTAVMSGNLT